MPSQNAGIATMIDVTSVTRMSQNEYLFSAETMPAPMPTTVSMMMATIESLMVYGYFAARMEATDWPLRWYDVPRSPCRRPLTYRP